MDPDGTVIVRLAALRFFYLHVLNGRYYSVRQSRTAQPVHARLPREAAHIEPSRDAKSTA
jgi:hypothetical protein